MSKNVFLIIGAIGSGKSFITTKLVQSGLINSNHPHFISSDRFKKEYFDVPKTESNPGYRASDEYFMRHLYYLMRKSQDSTLVIEFCPMSRNKIDPLIKILKSHSADITSLIVNTSSVNINVERTNKRNQEPGRDPVSEEKVKKSYDRFIEYSPLFVDVADVSYLIDNSSENYKVLAKIDNHKRTIDRYHADDISFEWVDRIINRYRKAKGND